MMIKSKIIKKLIKLTEDINNISSNLSNEINEIEEKIISDDKLDKINTYKTISEAYKDRLDILNKIINKK